MIRPDAVEIDIRSARERAERLAAVLETIDFRGPDPYAALAARRARLLTRSRYASWAALQGAKRLPRLARAVLGSADVRMAKTLALAVSAYLRLDRAVTPRVARLLDDLRAVRNADGAYGYEFPVVTRWGAYGQGTSNTIATVFALHAFADACQISGDDVSASEVARLADWLVALRGSLSFFPYYPGSPVLVHNANALAAGAIARAAAILGRDPTPALVALNPTLSSQAPDGSWAYAEAPRCGWIDNFHTLYLLRGLHEVLAVAPSPATSAAYGAGLAYYRAHLWVDGRPRTFANRDDSVIDGHTVGTALFFFAACHRDHELLADALRAVERLQQPEGWFASSTSSRPAGMFPRWVQGHVLLGLAAAASHMSNHTLTGH